MIRLFFLIMLILWIALELALASLISRNFGVMFVFFEFLVSFILGIKLMSGQPEGFIQQIQQEVIAGKDPKNIIFGRLRTFAAGFCLILPGFVSDGMGLLLLLMNLSKSNTGAAGTNAQNQWHDSSDSAANQQFDEVWKGDEFSEKMRKHKTHMNADSVEDATIISSEEDKDR